MPIEEIKEGYYAKKASTNETRLAAFINEYFNKIYATESSQEQLAAEIGEKLKPLLADLITQCVAQYLNKRITLEWHMQAGDTELVLRAHKVLKDNFIAFYINGLLQSSEAYTLSVDSTGYVSKLTLITPLSAESIVTLQCNSDEEGNK